jgi:hypothetical protein
MKWLEQNGWSGVKTNPNRGYNDGMKFTNGVKGEQIRIMTGGPTRSIPAKTGPQHPPRSFHDKWFGYPNG